MIVLIILYLVSAFIMSLLADKESITGWILILTPGLNTLAVAFTFVIIMALLAAAIGSATRKHDGRD
jgi:hypothetical protein